MLGCMKLFIYLQQNNLKNDEKKTSDYFILLHSNTFPAWMQWG